MAIFVEGRPVVSVVVPIYNDANRVERLVESLSRQKFEGYELIMVDDCSSDGTWQKLEHLADSRPISLFRAPTNRGSGFCRNLGVQAARGSIIAFTDSDCVPDPSWLAELTGPVARGEADATMGPNHLCLRNLRGCRLESVRAKQYRGLDTKNMAVRKDVFLSLGGFREDIRLNVDWEFHRRFVAAGYRLVPVNAPVLHDFPTDAISLVFKARRRGREEANLSKDAAAPLATLRLVGARMLAKLRRLPHVWSEGTGLAEKLAMVTYYLAFHASWNGSLMSCLLFSHGKRAA